MNQFGRKVGLVVSSDGAGIDLSRLRIEFHVEAMDAETPPTAVIRVLNLSDQTTSQIKSAVNQKVTLQAGYENGSYGVIFQGSVIRVTSGKLIPNVDKFVDIMASDLDQWFNFGIVSKTMAAGSSQRDRMDAILSQAEKYGATRGSISSDVGTGGVLPRGKVLFGLGRDRLSDEAGSAGTSWSISNGQLQVVPLTGYAPGEVVQINAKTGMIGVPEATTSGIQVQALINPAIRLGTRIQLNNADIKSTTVKTANINGQNVPVGFPNATGVQFFASLADNGVYRVIVAEHVGDNRGQSWFTNMTCLSVDRSAQPNKSVPEFG